MFPIDPPPPGIHSSPSSNSLSALRTQVARARTAFRTICLPASFDSGIDNHLSNVLAVDFQ